MYSLLIELVTTYKLSLPYTSPKCLALPPKETLTEKEKSLCNLVINIIGFCIISGSISPIPPTIFIAMKDTLVTLKYTPGRLFFLCETFLGQKSETFYGDAEQENVISE